MRSPSRRIGDLLVQTGVVTREAVEDLTAKGAERLGALLLERGFVGERDVTRAISAGGGVARERKNVNRVVGGRLDRLSVRVQTVRY